MRFADYSLLHILVVSIIVLSGAIEMALSELCVGFNQGLRRGQFVEL